MATLGAGGKRRTALAAGALAVIVAVPVGIAVIHEGFPVSAVDLYSRDVWVTNGAKLLTGRLNMQIEELNGGVSMGSRNFDVLQDGDQVFVFDDELGSVERVDPAYTSLGQRIEVPVGSTVDYGADLMAVTDPAGAVWVIPTIGELQFDRVTAEPSGEFGDGAQAVVAEDGATWVVSVQDSALLRIIGPGALPERMLDLTVDDFELTAVGDQPVILDRDTNEIVKADGGRIALPAPGMRIQQPSAAADSVLVATGDSLLRVGFGGQVEQFDGGASTANEPDAVAAPVVLGECLHGAWSNSGRYLGACDGEEPTTADVPISAASELVFRVNRNVIALNDVVVGDVWLVSENMRLVENWDEVTPPDLEEGEEGDETTSTQTFEDTLAERTEINTAPIARPDDVGVRPGRTTIIPVLDNDTDPDGDVLTISNLSEVSASIGVVQLIDNGRALQFVPAENAAGTVSFRYTASDGRPGGVAETQVNVTIRQPEENLPPATMRVSSLPVETGQTLTYNVLTDWRDPDGDELVLTGAASTTGDIVRFRPDGRVTFTSTSSEAGQKSVTVAVSDGATVSTGDLIVDVKPAGELNPIGTPDFGTGFVGDTIELSPLDNDRSPSGERLGLQEVETLTDGVTAQVDLDRGVVVASAPMPGSYYLKYTLTAGALMSSIGIIRVDVAEQPEAPLPPVAVKDSAFARPNEPVMVAALSNDQSPSGRVIGIQSIDLPVGSEQMSVEVLGSSVLRITTPSGMTAPITFGYTISDGVETATAAVTVVPVPELTKHQAPIARDDAVKVRVGDIATVAVLDNDDHPDGVRMFVDPELVQSAVGDDGLVFVNGDTVRFQAPTEPGQYSTTYRITDAFNEAAVASVVFTVVDADTENNQDPLPPRLTARVFQGGETTIEVPTSGIDPDGDSVQLVSVTGATLGEITGTGSSGFTYEAYDDTAGTDTFAYAVKDASGATATGEVRIGVIPRPETVMPPTAVNDAIAMRPDRVASVPVLANDSDPNGYQVKLLPDLLEVQEGITATVEGDNVVIEAGADEGTYMVRYAIDNEHGGTDDAFIIVAVNAAAPLQPPSAIDHVIELADVVGAETVDVAVLTGAGNPGGRVEDLVISVEGANSASGEVLDGAGGTVQITLTDTRQAIGYRLTNETDELSAMAFIVVPPYTSDLPPTLKPELIATPPNQRVNETKEWKLADLLDVPSGRPAIIINPETATAGRGNGDPIALDDTTIRFTPEADFRGETLLTFQVTDGESADDASGSQATIQMRVIVGDAEFKDVAPAFASTTVQIEAGETATTLDLRSASSHPNPAIISQLTYGGLTGSTSAISATISGSTLTLQSPFGTQPGTTTTVAFDVTYAEFTVPGQVEVVVVPSTRPLAQTVDDIEPEGRSSSTYTISPLTNDFNPFAADGQPLRIVGAVLEGDGLGATVSNTATAVTVRTGTAKSGTVSVIYTVRDATDTASREVQGRITVVVASAPEPVTGIALTNPGSETVTVVFDPPVSSNGAEITQYSVQMSGAPGTQTRTDCVPGAACQFTGRSNGSVQTVSVSATNRVGTTVSSTRTIVPYGTPSAPPSASASNGPAGAGYVTINWSAPSGTGTGGGTVNYEWRQLPSGGWNDVGTAQSASPSIGVGNSAAFEIRSYINGNYGRIYSAGATQTNVATAPNPPPPPPTWNVQVDAEATCSQTNGSHAGGSSCSSGGDRWIPANTNLVVSCYVTWSLSVTTSDGYTENPSTWYYISSGGFAGQYVAHRTLRTPYDPPGYVPPGMPGC